MAGSREAYVGAVDNRVYISVGEVGVFAGIKNKASDFAGTGYRHFGKRINCYNRQIRLSVRCHELRNIFFICSVFI
ncbi:hypothetical protein SDC9_192599 [bioreactor metagenome]|uniref:Uncharacterized protein n=1 Tax=bioreactor metagenome TaxID=1076179 RepID=A0A645I2P7_9ZZZZ